MTVSSDVSQVVIIGSGPAACTAAIYAARADLKPIMVTGYDQGGQLTTTPEVGNWPGATGDPSGFDLMNQMLEHVKALKVKLVYDVVTSVDFSAEVKHLTLSSGEVLATRAVIIATGISRKKLGIPGEKELFGKGVSYCAVCDCNFYRGRRAVIVGNESEAAVSAEMMTGYASETSWVAWDVQANPALVAKAEAAGVRMYRSKPKAILGEGKVESLELEDGTLIPTDGVFIELGARSSADLAMDLDVMPEMDDTIKVDCDCATGVPGVYACGDVTGRPWQVAKAVGQGCVAGTNAAAYAKGER